MSGGRDYPGAELTQRAWGDISDRLELILSKKGDGAGDIRRRLGLCLNENLGIVRNADTIAAADTAVRELKRELDERVGASDLSQAADYIHCEHVLLLAQMQIRASGMRRESRGVFFREDYPQQDDGSWRRNIQIQKVGDEMSFTLREPVDDTAFER